MRTKVFWKGDADDRDGLTSVEQVCCSDTGTRNGFLEISGTCWQLKRDVVTGGSVVLFGKNSTQLLIQKLLLLSKREIEIQQGGDIYFLSDNEEIVQLPALTDTSSTLPSELLLLGIIVRRLISLRYALPISLSSDFALLGRYALERRLTRDMLPTLVAGCSIVFLQTHHRAPQRSENA